jgi:GntR family transcriptional repressor for pyruvate dehydrogenase complex
MRTQFQPLDRGLPLSERVAERILAAILSGHLQPGDALPSERVLSEQFGVSRTVVREAVRSLAGRGAVDLSNGRGLRVARVDQSALRLPMNLFLRARPDVDYPQVHEVRVVLEVAIARLAALRATPDDLEALQTTCLALRLAQSVEAMSEADIQFHRLLCDAAHNDLFLLLLDSISDALMAVRRATFVEPGRVEVAASAHERILERLRARDPAGASHEMRAHLLDVELAWEKMQGVDGTGTEP